MISLKIWENVDSGVVIWYFVMSLPFSVGGGWAYSITIVCLLLSGQSSHPCIPSVRSVRTKKISVQKICVLDSYFIHEYIIIKDMSSLIQGKIHSLLWELWLFFNCIILFVCIKNGFRLIIFQKIRVLDLYLIHRYIIIINIDQFWFRVKSANYYGS